jgi:hypothetical protein
MTLEMQWVSAAIGGKLEDAQIRPAVPGATPKNIVALAHSKVKAKAVAEAAKATTRAKVRKATLRVKARETAKRAVKEVERREAKRAVNDHGLVRQAEQHLLH